MGLLLVERRVLFFRVFFLDVVDSFLSIVDIGDVWVFFRCGGNGIFIIFG